MKKPPVILIILAAIFCGAFAAPKARAAASFDFFYDSLQPYGEWVQVADYGYCWHPHGVDADWAPYTDGYWAYTDSGWTWVSYEDFGGITYHYGRWVDLDDEGWCWVPDYEWAPAWVSWRSNEEHIGWAPLPPRAHFVASIGFSSWVDREYDIGPRYYNFCTVRDFGSPALRPVIINRSRNVTIVNNTVNITNITVNGDRNIVYNGGPRYDVISRRSSRPIQTLRLVQRTELDGGDVRGSRFRARQQGNQLIVSAPEVERPEANFKSKREARIIENPRIDTGWNKIKDPKVRDSLRQKIAQQQPAIPKDAPAKAIDQQAVAIVEEKSKAQPATDTPERVVGGKEGRAAARNAVAPATAQPAAPTDPAQQQEAAQAAAAKQKGLKGQKKQPPEQLVPANAEAQSNPSGVPSVPSEPATAGKVKAGKNPRNTGIVPPPVVNNPVRPDAATTIDAQPTPPQMAPSKRKPEQRPDGQPPTGSPDATTSSGNRVNGSNQRAIVYDKGAKNDAAAAERQRVLQQQQQQDAATARRQNGKDAARQRAQQQEQLQSKQQQLQQQQQLQDAAVARKQNGKDAARQRAQQQQEQLQLQQQQQRQVAPERVIQKRQRQEEGVDTRSREIQRQPDLVPSQRQETRSRGLPQPARQAPPAQVQQGQAPEAAAADDGRSKDKKKKKDKDKDN